MGNNSKSNSWAMNRLTRYVSIKTLFLKITNSLNNRIE